MISAQVVIVSNKQLLNYTWKPCCASFWINTSEGECPCPEFLKPCLVTVPRVWPEKKITKYVLSFMGQGKICTKDLQILCSPQPPGIMTHKGELVEEKFAKSLAKKFWDSIPHNDIES